MNNNFIEVYEWQEGGVLPAFALDMLAIPPHGQVPQRGDVLHLHMPNDSDADSIGVVSFVVMERQLLWRFRDDETAHEPAPWSKMWIVVRRLSDHLLAANLEAAPTTSEQLQS